MEPAQLPVAQRAAAALATTPEYEASLRALAVKHVGITAITNIDGLKDLHSARMELKNVRLEIEKRGKVAREDAQAFAKAVIAEEKRLIGIIAAEEQRLQGLQDAWAAAREAERWATERAEQARIAAIQRQIDEMERLPYTLFGANAADIADLLDKVRADKPETWAQEMLTQATLTHGVVLAELEKMHAGSLAAEAEKKRQAEERAKLEAAQAELARRQREQQEAEEQARRQREEADRQARAKIEEEQRAARAKLDEEERQRKAALAAEEARLRAEQQRIDDERRRLEADARAEQFRKDEEARAIWLEEQRKREAEENARAMAEREQRRLEYERMEARQILEQFVELFGHLPEFGFIVVAIRSYFDKAKKAA